MKPLSTATPNASFAEEASLPLWERTMRSALASARAGQWQTATDGYRFALGVACELIEHPPAARIDDCLAALVVSFHNLAEARMALGAPDLAIECLCDAHKMLIALHIDMERPPALRQAALRHTRETHMALISHAADHGMHPLCARTLDTARQALGPRPAQPH